MSDITDYFLKRIEEIKNKKGSDTTCNDSRFNFLTTSKNKNNEKLSLKRNNSFDKGFTNSNNIQSKMNSLIRETSKINIKYSDYSSSSFKNSSINPVYTINTKPIMTNIDKDDYKIQYNTFMSSSKQNMSKSINIHSNITDKQTSIKDKIDSLSQQLNITKTHSIEGIFNSKQKETQASSNDIFSLKAKKKNISLVESKENDSLKSILNTKKKIDEEICNFSRELTWVPNQFKEKIKNKDNYCFKESSTCMNIFDNKSKSYTTNLKSTKNFDQSYISNMDKNKDKGNGIQFQFSSKAENSITSFNRILSIDDIKLFSAKIKLVSKETLDKSITDELRALSNILHDFLN